MISTNSQFFPHNPLGFVPDFQPPTYCGSLSDERGGMIAARRARNATHTRGLMNFYRRFPALYRNKTLDLGMRQHGVYNLLLDEQYQTEQPIKDMRHAMEIVRRRSKPDPEVTNRTEQRIVKFVLEKFFVRKRDGYWNPRVLDEIDFVSSKRKQTQKAARARHRKPGANPVHHSGKHPNKPAKPKPPRHTRDTAATPPRHTRDIHATNTRQGTTSKHRENGHNSMRTHSGRIETLDVDFRRETKERTPLPPQAGATNVDEIMWLACDGRVHIKKPKHRRLWTMREKDAMHGQRAADYAAFFRSKGFYAEVLPPPEEK